MRRFFLLVISMLPCLLAGQEQFSLYFDFDVDKADAHSGKKLMDWISANPDVAITKIYGYADSIGDLHYNMELSQRRADHVFYQLSRAHKNNFGKNIEVKGFGETRAFSDNRSSDRVVIIHFQDAEKVSDTPMSVDSPVVNNPVIPTNNLTLEVQKSKVGDKLKLPSLNFYNNSDIPLPESQPVLKELLDIMNSNPSLKIDIQGHICCEIVESNKISVKRAKKVYRFLQLNGIKSDRISYKGLASTRPIYPLPEKSELEKQANRRVEIQILAQ